MRKILMVTVTAAAFAAAAGSVRAEGFSLSFGTGGVAFTYDSGGYCDRWGCPDEFWDYPIYECPVFYEGEWYRGPVYYRRYDGRVWFWVHGGWHRDEWRGPRPAGFCVDQFRPALGFEFYETHGFHMRNDWRERWHRDHDRDRWRDQGNYNNSGQWNGGGNRDHRDNDHRDNKGDNNWQNGQNKNWKGDHHDNGAGGQNNNWSNKNWHNDSNTGSQGGQNNNWSNKNWHNDSNTGGQGGQNNTLQNKNWHNDTNAGGQTGTGGQSGVHVPAFVPRSPVTAPAAAFGTGGAAGSSGGHTGWQNHQGNVTTTTTTTTTTNNSGGSGGGNGGGHEFSGGHGGGNNGSNPRIDSGQTHRQ